MSFIDRIPPKRIYIIAVTTLIVLIVSNQILIQKILEEKKDDASIINLAGRQRMLSQMIAKTVFLSENDEINLEVLQRDVELFTSTHNSLQDGNESLGLKPNENEAIATLFDEIKPHFEVYTTSLANIQNQEDVVSAIPIIKRHEFLFLRKMDEIVATFESISTDSVNYLIWIEVALGLFSLLVIGGEIYLVFRVFLSQLKSKNEELEASAELFEEVQNSVKFGTWEIDLETGKSTLSKEVYRLYGLPEGYELEAEEGMGFYREDFHPAIEKAFNELLENEIPYDIELVLVSKQGEENWVRTSGYPVYKDDEFIKVRGVFMDINEQKLTAIEKENAQKIFKSVFNSTFSFMGLLEKDGTIIEINNPALEFSGFTSEEVRGLLLEEADWWPTKQERELSRNAVKKASKGETVRLDLDVLGGDGTILRIDFSIVPIFDTDGNVIYLVPEGRDITEREEINRELSLTKERLEEAQEITKIGNWNWDMIKDEITWSDQNYEVFGQPKSFKPNFEALNKLIPEEDREPFQKDVEQAIEKNIPHDFIHRIVLDEGKEVRYIHERGRVFYNKEGTPLRMAGTSQDVTEIEQNKAELETKAKEIQRGLDLLSETQHAAKIGSWEVDLATMEAYWSDEVYRIHEVPIGKEIKVEEGIQFYREDYQDVVQQAINQAIENKKSWDVECILVTAKDKEVWVRATGHPIFENGELVGLRGLFMDIDEPKRKALEMDEINRKLQLSVEAGRIAIWIWDLKTNEIDWNDMAYEVFGVDKNVDLTFDIFGTMVHPDDLDYVIEATQTTIEKGERLDIEFRWNRPDGKEIFLSGRGNVVVDEEGNPVQMIGINMNITERMKLVESIRLQESQLRSFVEQAPAAVAMFDNNMRYITASNKWYEHNKIEGENIIGESHYEVLPQVQKREDWVKIHQRVLKGEELSNPKDQFTRKDGTQIWIQWTSIPWFNSANEIGGMILYVSDITKEVEYTDQLEREIKTRTLQITKQAKSLEEVNKELESFSYSISHDLRAPLRSINGFSDILLEDYAEQLDDEGKRLIEVVKDSAITMGQLIDNILDFSRLGKKAIQKNEVDVKSLFENVVQEESYGYKESEIEVTITELPNTVGDIALLKQVAVNLVSNALKYSSKKDISKIIIDFEETDDKYVYSISDNGTGFKMEYHDKLFGVFQRLHSKNDFEGTGVGLAIVKRIINKHGGEIWAESTVGEGSTFFFSLPKK